MSSLCQICTRSFRCQWANIQGFLHPSCDKDGASEACKSPPISSDAKTSCKASSNGDDFEGNDDVDSKDSSSNSSKRLKLSFSPLETSTKPLDITPTTLGTSPSHIASDVQSSVDSQCCPSVCCVACLGLLEEQYIHHLAEVITRQFRLVSPTGMKTFSLAIHIPLSIAARGTGMEALLKRTRSDQVSSESAANESNYVKDELRLQLRKVLEKSLSPLTYYWDSPLSINLSLDHDNSLETCTDVKKLRPKLFPHQRRRRNKKYMPTPITSLPLQKALKELDDEEFERKNYFLSPISSPCSHHVEFLHRSCFVAGRYNKYSRELPQTPWVVDGVKKAETSVEELFCPKIRSAFRASDTRFSSSGREDVDVLMLGQGRPFLLELINPMNVSVGELELEAIEKEVNAETEQVAVHKLKAVSKESSVLLKQGEEDKRKVYSALVWTKVEMGRETLQLLDEKKDLVIRQRTPIRVLHRRTLAVRERTIYCMKTERIDSHHFLLRMETQAGTYIKEFVHGDFGRTQPNASSLLGCDADILSLDVLDVHLHWPP